MFLVQFARSGDLKRHIRTQAVEKPYRCDVCCAQFATSANLKSHIHNHIGENPYKCDTCGVQFAVYCNQSRAGVLCYNVLKYICT